MKRSFCILGSPLHLIRARIILANGEHICTHTEHGELFDFVFLKGQNTLIFKQHHCSACCFKRKLLMPVTAHKALSLIPVCKGLIHKSDAEFCRQHTQKRTVNILFADPTLVVCNHQIVIGILRQVNIHARLQACRLSLPLGIIKPVRFPYTLNRVVVGHNKALKAPFVAQDICKKTLVAGAGNAVPTVVSGHNRHCTAIFDAPLEGLEIHLTHCAFAGVRNIGIPAAVGIVIRIVLGGCDNAVFLQTFTDCNTHIGA